jgi:hypothetical protein
VDGEHGRRRTHDPPVGDWDAHTWPDLRLWKAGRLTCGRSAKRGLGLCSSFAPDEPFEQEYAKGGEDENHPEWNEDVHLGTRPVLVRGTLRP